MLQRAFIYKIQYIFFAWGNIIMLTNGIESIKQVFKSSNVQRWLIFALASSMIPFFLILFVRWLEGAKLSDLIPLYLPDFLLVVLSVAVATCESASAKKSKWRKGTMVLAIISAVFCWGFYWKSDGSGLRFAPGRLEIFLVLVAVLLVTNSFFGIRAEYKNEID